MEVSSPGSQASLELYCSSLSVKLEDHDPVAFVSRYHILASSAPLIEAASLQRMMSWRAPVRLLNA